MRGTSRLVVQEGITAGDTDPPPPIRRQALACRHRHRMPGAQDLVAPPIGQDRPDGVRIRREAAEDSELEIRIDGGEDRIRQDGGPEICHGTVGIKGTQAEPRRLGPCCWWGGEELR